MTATAERGRGADPVANEPLARGRDAGACVPNGSAAPPPSRGKADPVGMDADPPDRTPAEREDPTESTHGPHRAWPLERARPSVSVQPDPLRSFLTLLHLHERKRSARPPAIPSSAR